MAPRGWGVGGDGGVIGEGRAGACANQAIRGMSQRPIPIEAVWRGQLTGHLLEASRTMLATQLTLLKLYNSISYQYAPISPGAG